MLSLLDAIQKAVTLPSYPLLCRKSVEKVGITAGVLLASYLITTRVYEALFGPLSPIPGPFFSKFFDWTDGHYDKPSGTRFKHIMALHQKYGHIVRIGRKKLSVSDKDMIQQILVKEDWEKADLYKSYQLDGYPTVFDATDKEFHKTRRRILSPAFSVRYISSMEPLMHTATERVILKIKDEILKANAEGHEFAEIDLWRILQHFAIDIIGLAAFGTDFNMVVTGSHPLPSIIQSRLKFVSFIILYPTFTRWIPKSQDPYLKTFMKDVIQQRIESGERRQDILQYMIETTRAKSSDDRLRIDDIINDVILFLVAGSETSASSMGFLFVEMLRNPGAFEKLQQEIDSIELEDGQTLFHHSQVKSLPYLNASIDETLRMHPANPGGLPRKAVSDTVLGGKVRVPKNTTVFAMGYAAQMHSDYWDEPETFRPERWLDPATAQQCADASFPFSAGSRNCIGKMFSMQEMRLCLSTLIKHFDFKPIAECMEDAKDRRQFVTLNIANNTFKVKMSLRH